MCWQGPEVFFEQVNWTIECVTIAAGETGC